MNTDILERLTVLPPKLSADIRTCYVEAGDSVVAPFAEWREKGHRAHSATFEWIKSKGGIGYFGPRTNWGRGEQRALVFCFDKKQTDAAWKSSSWRAEQGVAVTPSRTKAGRALTAEIEALPAWPSDHEVIDIVGPPCTIRYTTTGSGDDGAGSGMATVGSDGGRLFFSTVFYAGDRFFVSFPNPFYDLARMASSESSFYAGMKVEGDLLDWRPPEGFTLLSKAEVELIFAKAKVEAEERKAA